jgi:hypothetical protein
LHVQWEAAYQRFDELVHEAEVETEVEPEKPSTDSANEWNGGFSKRGWIEA